MRRNAVRVDSTDPESKRSVFQRQCCCEGFTDNPLLKDDSGLSGVNIVDPQFVAHIFRYTSPCECWQVGGGNGACRCSNDWNRYGERSRSTPVRDRTVFVEGSHPPSIVGREQGDRRVGIRNYIGALNVRDINVLNNTAGTVDTVDPEFVVRSSFLSFPHKGGGSVGLIEAIRRGD